MTGQEPRVSVILPVYNGAGTVKESISSILRQKHVALELVVVDDASTDESRDIVQSINDPRIVRLDLNSNRGLAGALNEGIAASRAPLIARQDQDDLAHPHRLARQLAVLYKMRNLVLLGTWAEILAPDGEGRWQAVGQHCHPEHDDELRVRLLWNNPFVHSSVVFSREAFEAAGGYRLDEKENYPEDYDLWSRLARVGTLGNVPECLVSYRTTPDGMSRTNAERLQRGVIRIGSRNMAAAANTSLEDPSVWSTVETLNNAPNAGRSLKGTLASVRTFWRASHSVRLGGRNLYLLRLKTITKIAVRSLISA